MRRAKETALIVLMSLALLAPAHGAGQDGGSGSLRTAQFPDVVKFDFEEVNRSYEQASEKVGKVTPILDRALEKGQEAVQAGESARQDPTDENKRKFIQGVLEFVQGAEKSQTEIAGLQEDIRNIHSQTSILYEQAVTKTRSRLEELSKEYRREEVKYKDMVAQNKEKRKNEDLSDWNLRKLYHQEKRQAQKLNTLADRMAFQKDFLKALKKAKERSAGDFNVYEQFFAQASGCLENIENLASNVPLVARRLQLSAAMKKNIPSRKAAAAGFQKIEKTRQITQKLADQLNALSAGDMGLGESSDENSEQTEQTIIRHTRTYEGWLNGEEIQYRRPPESSE